MKMLLNFIGAVILVVGVAMLLSALTTPSSYNLAAANAIQSIQVYVQAIAYGVASVSLFLLTLIVMTANNRDRGYEPSVSTKTTSAIGLSSNRPSQITGPEID